MHVSWRLRLSACVARPGRSWKASRLRERGSLQLSCGRVPLFFRKRIEHLLRKAWPVAEAVHAGAQQSRLQGCAIDPLDLRQRPLQCLILTRLEIGVRKTHVETDLIRARCE